MKLLSYWRDETLRHGYLIDADHVAELGNGDLTELISAQQSFANWSPPTAADPIPLANVTVTAPILRPGKVLAVAANYQEHVAESGGTRLDKARLVPRIFMKPSTAIAGPLDVIPLPAESSQVDWEAELVVVLGRGGRNVSTEEALDLVAGYATGNDVSARSVDYGLSRDVGTVGASAVWFFDWLAGKSFDAFAPYGPYLVTTDEVEDPQDLDVTLEVNGKRHQDGNTRDMIFTVAELIAFCSRLMTLEAGDVIFTGTPAGVGAATGEFLQTGDEMVVRIGDLGTLVNTVH